GLHEFSPVSGGVGEAACRSRSAASLVAAGSSLAPAEGLQGLGGALFGNRAYAIRAEQAEQLAGRHVEVDPPDGLDSSWIRLPKSSDFDGVWVHGSSSHSCGVSFVRGMTDANGEM